MKFELDLEKDALLDLLSGMQPHKLDELLQTNGHFLIEFLSNCWSVSLKSEYLKSSGRRGGIIPDFH